MVPWVTDAGFGEKDWLPRFPEPFENWIAMVTALVELGAPDVLLNVPLLPLQLHDARVTAKAAPTRATNRMVLCSPSKEYMCVSAKADRTFKDPIGPIVESVHPSLSLLEC